MHGQTKISPKSWLAFDLNVLRRLKFDSVAIPLAGQPALGAYLKRWNVRVATNDPLQSTWACAFSQIANPGHRLTTDEVNTVLEDAYVPGYLMNNQGLSSWFSETDAWWFDNVRKNIDRLQTTVAKALAASIALAAGNYVFYFKESSRELRQPLSQVFKRLRSIQPEPHDNGQQNSCSNKNADDFIPEVQAELMFLRLPAAHAQAAKMQLGRSAWREEWLRGGNEFWPAFETSLRGKLGAPTETKSQYLHLLEETLNRASHIRTWAIAYVEDGFIQTQDIADTIGKIRRVDSIYTKDFSELTGTRAAIITA
jgi:hypothetical protein